MTMKSKKLFGIAALCCASMVLFACNDAPTPTPPDPPTPTYYTVTFYSEGEVFTTKQAEANDTVEAPTTEPTKDDYVFIGWYTDETEGEKWVFETDVVNSDMSLYAHFEEEQVDYTVKFFLDGVVVETKTTNSHDKTDITIPQVAVEEGKALLGFGEDAGTTSADVDYRVGSIISYDDVVLLADTNNIVSLYAIVKTGTVLELNIAQWERYCDDNCIDRVVGAFKEYADDNSVAYDFLTVTKFASATSDDPNYSYKDLATNIDKDKNITVVFPVNNNFINELTGKDAARIKFSQSLGVDIKNAHGETTESGRLVARLTEDAISTAFTTWLLSDDGKVVLDPDYVPSTEHGEASATKFIIGVWGRYFSQDLTTGLVNAYKTYLTSENIAYDEVNAVYFEDANYHSKANYLPAAADDLSIDVLLPVSKAIAKGTDTDIPSKMLTKYTTALNLGDTDGEDEGLGLTIGGETNRWLITLNSDVITSTFIDFVKTEEGMKALDPSHGETPVTQTTLKISYYGRFLTDESYGTAITNAVKAYFDANSITYTSVTSDYVDSSANTNDKYATAMASDADISLFGAANLSDSLSAYTTRGGLGVYTYNSSGKATERYYYTFNAGDLTAACIEFLLSSDGLALMQTYFPPQA